MLSLTAQDSDWFLPHPGHCDGGWQHRLQATWRETHSAIGLYSYIVLSTKTLPHSSHHLSLRTLVRAKLIMTIVNKGLTELNDKCHDCSSNKTNFLLVSPLSPQKQVTNLNRSLLMEAG